LSRQVEKTEETKLTWKREKGVGTCRQTNKEAEKAGNAEKDKEEKIVEEPCRYGES